MLAQDFLNTYNSFLKIYNYSYLPQTSYNLYLLKRSLQKHYDFLIEKEQELLNQYSVTFQEDGTPTFNSEKEQKDFFMAHQNLSQIQLDLSEIHKIVLNINELPNNITPLEIELLSNIIDFKEE